MKKLSILLLLNFLICSLAYSQLVPKGMKYQAVARDLMGNVMANQEIVLQINLTSPQTKGGRVYYSETHAVTTNQFGLFTLTVGEGKLSNGGFASIPWSSEDIWMEVAIRDKGKSNFATLSSSKLLAVPYAIHAATASELVGTKSNPQARAAAGDPVTNGVPSQNWSLFGNSKSDETKDRIGTTDYMGLIFITNNIERLKITRDGDINIANTLNVGKDVNIGRNLTVDQNVYLNKVGGQTINYGPFTVDRQSPSILTGTLRVDGITTITNPTESTAKTNGALIVAGGTGVGKNLNVGGKTDLDGTLNVDGITTISNVTESTGKTNGALVVVGGVGIGKNINVGGNADIDGTLNTDGATTLKNTLIVDGATTLNNTLNVVGNTTIQGITNVTNQTESTLPTNGAFFVAGGVGIGKNLNVGGNQINNGNLNVKTNTDLDGTLNVDGVTTLNNTLNVNKTAALNGQVTITADVNGSDENYGSYPLRVQGSNQGIAIKVDGSRDNSTNFVTFMDDTQIWGRIEGETVAELEGSQEYKTQVALYILEGVATAADIAGLTVEVAGLTAALITIPAAVGVAAQLAAVIIRAAALVTEATTWSTSVHNNVGVAYSSGSGDYAEWLERAKDEQDMTFGQIVGVKGGKISLGTDEVDHYMVISKSPIVLGNMPQPNREKDYEKVAFMGQVPVRVVGKVAIGDYIIPSGNHDGFGLAVHPADMKLGDYARIVGVSWQAAKDAPLNIVNVAVGINTNDLTSRMVALNEKVDGILAYLQGKGPLPTGELATGVATAKIDKGNMAKQPQAQTTMAKMIPDADFDRAIDNLSPQLLQYFEEVKTQLTAKGVDTNANPYLAELFKDPVTSVKQLRRDPSMGTQWGRVDQKLQKKTNK